MALAPNIRPAAVAGAFYPGDPQRLAAELDELLDGVADFEPRIGFPKALVVPHALLTLPIVGAEAVLAR